METPFMYRFNRRTHQRFPLFSLAALIVLGSVFVTVLTSPVFGQGTFPYSSPSSQQIPSYQPNPFAAPAPPYDGPTLSSSQPGYESVQQIQPTTYSSQSMIEPVLVPLEQNSQYLDPRINSLHPQQYAAENIPDYARLNSTTVPDPSSLSAPITDINPAEIRQSQNMMTNEFHQGSQFDSQFIPGSSNFRETPINDVSENRSGFMTANGMPILPSSFATTAAEDSFFSQSAKDSGLVALDPNQPENPDELVIEVIIEGNGGVPEETIRKKIKTLAGRPFKAQMVEEDARTLHNTGSFAKVSPYIRKNKDGVTVVFRLVERPLLHFVKILGNRQYTKEELKEETGLKPGDPMDVSAVLQARDKIEAKYTMDGFPRVHVDILEGDLPSDRGAAFLINESVKQRVLTTAFAGNIQITSGRLNTQIASKPGILYYIGGEFTREKLDADVQTLLNYYRKLGFFNAKIGREYEESSGFFGIDPPNSWVKVRFIISEGIRSKINSVKFLGNKIYSSQELEKNLKIKKGSWFDHDAVESDKNKVKEMYGAKGYVFTAIKEDIRYLEQPGMIDIVYMIRENQTAVASDVRVEFDSDQTHTKITSILDRVDIRPGQMITREKINESNRMLRYDKFLNTMPTEGTVPTVQVVPSDPETRKRIEESQNFDDYDMEAEENALSPLYRGQSPEKQPLSWGTPSLGTPMVPISAGNISTGNVVNAVYQGTGFPQENVIQAGYQTETPLSEPVQQVQYGQYPVSPSSLPPASSPFTSLPSAEQTAAEQPGYYQYTPSPSTQSNPGNYPVTPVGSTIPTFPRSVQTTVTSDSGAFIPSTITSPSTMPPVMSGSLYDNPERSNVYGSTFESNFSPITSPSSLSTPASVYAPSTAPVTQGGYYGDNLEYGSISQVSGVDPWSDSTINRPVLGAGVGRMPYNSSPIPDYIPSDVVVRVSEGRTGSIMASVMVNSDAGLMGRFAIQENNFDWKRVPTNPLRFESWRKAFRGGGQQFLIEAMPGSRISSYNVMWRDPRFLHTKYSLGLNGSYYTRYYDEWRENRLGGGVSLGRAWTNRFSTTISTSATQVKVYDPINTFYGIPTDIDNVLGKNNLYGFGLSAAYDFRDSPMMATEGGLISGGVEQVLGTHQFIRANVDVRRYLTLYERLDRSGRWVLGLRSATGWTSDNTPVFERYFAGGTSTIRGFEFRGVSPRWFLTDVAIGGNFEFYNSAEICFPLSYDDNIRGVFFVDSGTVESTISDWKYDYRVTAGFGLRLCIPAMGPVPIAFDFGFPICKDRSDKTQVFSFTMQFMR